MEKKRNSRWKTDPKLVKGKPDRIRFGPLDLEICKLFLPGTARAPWGYQYLTKSYVAALLNRGPVGLGIRLYELTRKPYLYLRRPEQPINNYREIIYAIETKGLEELREAGLHVPRFHHNKLPHELMRCICAASFEIGAAEQGLVIDLQDFDSELRPDWPVFKLAGHRVFLEADVASETLDTRRPDTTSIDGKFEEYLKLIQQEKLKDAMVLFVTTSNTRRDSMIELLRTVIDRKGDKELRELARHFGFASIAYDKWLNKIPKPSGWAVTGEWLRASQKHGPFKFI